MTQLGFLRLFCNPRVTALAMTPAIAYSVLETVIQLPEHEFWPDDIPASEMFRNGAPITGPKQFTDRYLIALATAHDGVVATFTEKAAMSAGTTV